MTTRTCTICGAAFDGDEDGSALATHHRSHRLRPAAVGWYWALVRLPLGGPHRGTGALSCEVLRVEEPYKFYLAGWDAPIDPGLVAAWFPEPLTPPPILYGQTPTVSRPIPPRE